MGSITKGGSRVEWTIDFLPDNAATTLDGLMNAGATAMARALQALGGQGAGTADSSR